MKPADDLCDVCLQNNLDIMQASNLDDKSKEAQLTKALDHLKAVHAEQEYYNSMPGSNKGTRRLNWTLLSR